MVGPDPAHLGAPALDQPVVHGTWSVDYHWVTAEVMRERFHHDMALTFRCREPPTCSPSKLSPNRLAAGTKRQLLGQHCSALF